MSIKDYLENSYDPNIPLSTDLFDKLQQDILSGRLKKGSKLTEKKICEEYHVSRTPVRESLRKLETDGLIESIPNRGAFVVGLSEQDLKDIYAIKSSVETRAIVWAIERITAEELEKLKETFNYMVFYTHRNDIAKMISINLTFHKIIYEATHNHMLEKQLSTYQLYLESALSSSYYLKSGLLNELLDEHRDIYKAFIERDTAAVVEALIRHNTNSYIRHFGESPSDAIMDLI